MAKLRQSPSPNRFSWARYLYLLIAAGVIFFDQLTKELSIAFLEPNQPTALIGELVQLRLVFNDSAAFSIGFGLTWVFAIISSLAALATIWFGLKVTVRSWSIMTGIFLGGVVGNLIDRLMRPPGFGIGHVVDFLQIPFNFPIFNFADVAVVTMAFLTVWRVFRGENLGGLPSNQK